MIYELRGKLSDFHERISCSCFHGKCKLSCDCTGMFKILCVNLFSQLCEKSSWIINIPKESEWCCKKAPSSYFEDCLMHNSCLETMSSFCVINIVQRDCTNNSLSTLERFSRAGVLRRTLNFPSPVVKAIKNVQVRESTVENASLVVKSRSEQENKKLCNGLAKKLIVAAWTKGENRSVVNTLN